MALAATDGLEACGGHSAAPSRHSSDQLFMLEWEKSICAVDCSYPACHAAFKETQASGQICRDHQISHNLTNDLIISSDWTTSSMHGIYRA